MILYKRQRVSVSGEAACRVGVITTQGAGVVAMVGSWVRTGAAYIEHDTYELVRLGKEFVMLPVARDGAFRVVGLHGGAVSGAVPCVSAA